MKNLYVLLVCLISLSTFSQNDYSRYYNSWRLGLNLGGAWQTADYRSCWGIAGGITLEKGFHENATNIFSFAIRGRYLGANTYGMDYNRNYNVKSNDAYNGKYDPKVNFVDSVSVAKQYVYDNYKMKLGEGSLELQVTFNRLRERTHVLLNLWGGIGFTSYRTKSDLQDGAGKMYDFSLVDSTGNKTKALNSYNGLIDKNYESYAYGSRNGNLVTFSPSLGIGLGYQFSPSFSMLWEYKVTFPQGTNADLLDGKLAANKDFFGSNDYYHYTGLNLVFTLRAKKKTTPVKDETVYTNTIAPTNTVVVAPPTNSVIAPPTNTVVTTPPPSTEPKPIISYITPPVNGHVVNVQQYKLSAQILNVNAANQIQFKFNGVSYTNFSFNTQTHILEYNSNLINGSNSVQIIASNTAGQDNKTTTVVYNQPKVNVPLPVVTYITPNQPGSITANSAYVIKAQVLNVNSPSDISFYYNGLSTTFSYNTNTKQLTYNANLNPGLNAISITANNSAGEDTKVTDVTFREVKAQAIGMPPVVSLVVPTTSINATDIASYNFKLSVLNVASKSDIQVTLNGVAQPNFIYNTNIKEVFLHTNLIVGNNTLVVKATTAYGSDTKQVDVMYTPHAEIKLPPMVTITNPANVATTSNPNYIFKATVGNVPNASGLAVKFNGALVTNYVYDGFNLSFNTNLIQGNNGFEVTATNNDGTDTKTANVNYKVKVVPVLPVVNLINPPSEINATDVANYNFKLAVLNVNSKADIEFLFNGVPQTNFTYDLNTKEVFLQTNLIVGNNTVSVKGTNQFGSDVKQITVEYTPHAEIKLPPSVTFVNPSINGVSFPNPNYMFTATISNMSASASSLVVKYNGMVITNYSYDGYNVSYQAVLNTGANSLEIAATNADGNDVKTATVTYKPKALPKPPVVTILQPVATPTVGNIAYNFSFKATNVTQNQVQVVLNGNAITSFSFSNTMGSFVSNLAKDENVLIVKATNQDGTDSKAEKVYYIYTPPADTTTSTNGSNSTSAGGKTIIVCHKVAGSDPQTLTVPINLLGLHLGHGDTKGACPVKADSVQIAPIKMNTTPHKGNSVEDNKGTTPKETPRDTIDLLPHATPRRPH